MANIIIISAIILVVGLVVYLGLSGEDHETDDDIKRKRINFLISVVVVFLMFCGAVLINYFFQSPKTPEPDPCYNYLDTKC